MAIDIDQARSVRRLLDQMIVPDLVIERAGLGHIRNSQFAAAEVRLFRRLVLSRPGGGFDMILALDDASGFSAPAAQVIKLGAAYLAAAHDFYRVDHRRIERKHPLDAFAV